MRQEDTEIEGFELERAEARKRDNELIEDDEQELYDLDGKPEFDRDRDRTNVIACAMQKIFEREHIIVNDLDLSQSELRALDALKAAVEGRDQSKHGFVYAEDRRTLLEQALAVLQPDLVNLERAGGEPFDELLKDVAALREQLNVLEDAQEELEPRSLYGAEKGEAGDADDKPPEAIDDQSLTGPERKIEKPKSSLAEGPAIAEPAKQPTTLGDPKEIAEAARPWWKR